MNKPPSGGFFVIMKIVDTTLSESWSGRRKAPGPLIRVIVA
jgi:hypothetical protein